MLGRQKQYYAWIGCLQAANAVSYIDNVTLQRFERGYVIEGVLNPPQSRYRKRIVLLDGGGWKFENMDDSGKVTSDITNP